MKRKISIVGVKALGFVGLLLLLGVLSGGEASAQRWESTFGSLTCNDYGRSVLVSSVTGRYYCVGETKMNSPSCNGTDIYLVIPTNHGTPLLTFTYDIGGGDDSATCIYECAGGTGFIITGVTTIKNDMGECPTTSREAFLLRVDVNGDVIWVKTYGDPDLDELPTGVIETTGGNGTTTNPGDFVFCGQAWMPDGSRDAYMVRTDRNGNVIWGKTYGGASGLGDAFMALDESGLPANPGSIIAAGTTSYNPATMKSKFLLARIDGNTGNLINAIQWGGSERNVLYSVDEMRVSPYSGYVAVAGVTANISLTRTTNDEIYVAQVPGSFTGPLFWQARYGDRNVSPDVAYCIRENRGSRPGNLMVAGSSGFTAGGDLDAFLAELKPNNLGLAPGGVGFKMYGSTQQEEVFSLAQVADQPDIQTAGFLLAGCSNGVGVTLPSSYQLYVIKTDDAGNSACPSTDMQLVPFTPSFTRAVMGMTTTPRAQSCDRYTQFYPPYEPWNRACNADDGIIYWRAGRDPIGGQESDGAASVSDERGMAGATLFSSFPNPVATGNTLTLACTLAKDAEVAVEIADMAGRTVHAETRSGAAGELQIPVSTEGWSAGVYVVKMTVGKDVMMRKIVVSGK